MELIENKLESFDTFFIESKNDLINIVLKEEQLEKAINILHQSLIA